MTSILRKPRQRGQFISPNLSTRRGALQGVETQRQWTDTAIARTTPCLLGLFSLVTLLGKQLTPYARRATATSAWYRKQRPTFADTLAAVRRDIWQEQGFGTSNRTVRMTKLRPAIRNAITYALCHAA